MNKFTITSTLFFMSISLFVNCYAQHSVAVDKSNRRESASIKPSAVYEKQNEADGRFEKKIKKPEPKTCGGNNACAHNDNGRAASERLKKPIADPSNEIRPSKQDGGG